jgi:hypothetical protein
LRQQFALINLAPDILVPAQQVPVGPRVIGDSTYGCNVAGSTRFSSAFSTVGCTTATVRIAFCVVSFASALAFRYFASMVSSPARTSSSRKMKTNLTAFLGE